MNTLREIFLSASSFYVKISAVKPLIASKINVFIYITCTVYMYYIYIIDLYI